MKLIVGIGNPGEEFENTRHNIGFMVLDYYLNDPKWKKKFNSYYFECEIDRERVVFVKPKTYVNLSGEAVIKFMKYFKIDIEDILIIHDDLDLKLGSYKLKKDSSSGGHNGLKSIINHLHSQEFLRLKIGISNNKNLDTKNYVLGRLTKSEQEILRDVFENANKIIESFIRNGVAQTMNVYNTKKAGENDEISK